MDATAVEVSSVESTLVNSQVVRMELAEQLRQNNKPNLPLAERLEKIADSGKPEIIFSRGQWPNISVDLVGEELPEEVGIQYLDLLENNAALVINRSRLPSKEIHREKGKPPAQVTIGERLLDKKLRHFESTKRTGQMRACRFIDIPVTQESAENLIKSIMKEPKTVIVRDYGITIFNSAGQGITIEVASGEWIFLRFDDSTSWFKPRNLQN